MELLTIILSGILGLITPAGLIIDRTAENTIKKQFEQVEELKVRVDNAPTHQLIQGKIERIRVAGRGLKIKGRDIRIAALEVETDAVQIDPNSLLRRRPQIQKPLQTGLRIVLQEKDVNKLLQSPEFLSQLRKLNIVDVNLENEQTGTIFTLVNPRIRFLANNRVNLRIELRNQDNTDRVEVEVESGIKITKGRQLQLIAPVGNVEGEKIPPRLLNQIVENLNQRFDLRKLEDDGLQMRILQLDIKPGQIEVASFVRILPTSKFFQTLRKI
ncbi:LmeA family phospholipid-binding protein [Calothrix sp. NIES-3974]|uniref:LmeA family phospholipid-binding protein n=1 Tax=Calothrix sp. NIES-3974 TaxID=2005462 RepID=UPI000B5E298F|nr:DUF2993 domain-containing protein [Calothrix sp. NIES-3974]BAZ08061.1 hypothetical protein NIES3974_47300 [Calothrix sp. NIES-3974]